MALTREDLLAIKIIVDESVSGIKEDVSVLKTEMAEVKADIIELKEDVSKLKEDVSNLQSDMETVKINVSNLQTDMEFVKEEVIKVQVVQLENRLIPAVDEIISYQKSTYDRYNRSAALFEEKTGVLDTTVQIVAELSRQVKELQLKQA